LATAETCSDHRNQLSIISKVSGSGFGGITVHRTGDNDAVGLPNEGKQRSIAEIMTTTSTNNGDMEFVAEKVVSKPFNDVVVAKIVSVLIIGARESVDTPTR
jgi:hypothetical protein